jgi:hypothetical protein
VADFGAARVDSTGATAPTYPFFCGSNLTKAMVWGIDAGWAIPVQAGFTASARKVPDGHYRLTITISRTYRTQLGLVHRLVTAHLAVHVQSEQGGPCPKGIDCRGTAAVRTRAGVTAAQPQPNPTTPQVTGGGLPDLAALPAHDLTVEHAGTHDYLDFGATIWNAGPGELDVEGFRHRAKPLMTAVQYVYRAGQAPQSAGIGSFEFDSRPGHDHWHLEDVARYDLLDAQHQRVVVSDKQSFCLAPTDPVDLTRPGAIWEPDTVGLFSSCPTDQSIWLRETLPAGWGDTYLQSAAGQAFDITKVPNGRYLVRVTANPFHRILEVSHRNNTSLLRVRLGGDPGHRTVQIL